MPLLPIVTQFLQYSFKVLASMEQRGRRPSDISFVKTNGRYPVTKINYPGEAKTPCLPVQAISRCGKTRTKGFRTSELDFPQF